MWSKTAFIVKFMLLLSAIGMTAGQIALAGENKALKADLESQLVGKTVVSKIIFGGKAVPPGYQGDYPVNTLVSPDTGAVTYRVEWGVMRAEVGEREMVRRFESGTSFRVSGIEMKDDRLEIKLDGGGGSARLKLMLGAGWQSKLDAASVQAQLARVFVLEQQDARESKVEGHTPAQVASVEPGVTATTAGSDDYAEGEAAYKQGDYGKALPLISRAAEAGYVKAQLYLGEIYLTGKGATKDEQKALIWFTKAAEQGDSTAQFNLGVMYAMSLGVSQDYKKAFEWFTKAAEQGNAEAQDNLGVMYENGAGVNQSYVAAYDWYQKAAKQGNTDAARHAELVKLKAFSKAEATQSPSPLQVRENAMDGLKYVWIPPGTFMMGCSPGDDECLDNEKPPHQVTITKGFWMGQTEVTVRAYKRFITGTGRQMPKEPWLDGRYLNRGWVNEALPMADVTWDDAQSYCGWAGGRLPTEAEWEYAARAGNTASRYGDLDEIAWDADNSGSQRIESARVWRVATARDDHSYYTSFLNQNLNNMHEVGQKRPNDYGLYDMLGNVWEWVNDWYDENYYQNSPVQDPAGPTSGRSRVLRGGSMQYQPMLARASYRSRHDPDSAVDDFGFRCIQNDGISAHQETRPAISRSPAPTGEHAASNPTVPRQQFEEELTGRKPSQLGNPTVLGWVKNGESCYYGKGEPASGCPSKDYAKAFAWFQRAAERGNANAMGFLGNMYRYGQSVQQNYGQALDWYERSAERGDAGSQFDLGNMYYRGEGIPKDYAKAFEWLSKSAEQGNGDAQATLGVMYEKGKGVPQDYKKAFDLYTKAARQGNDLAQYNLGVMYMDGVGVEKDYTVAYYWYEAAAGNTLADELAKLVAKSARHNADLIRPNVDFQRLAQLHQARPSSTGRLSSNATASRQQFAEELTGRMSKEICWCAGGRSGELLAGYATTSQLSPGTLSQLEATSPLYRELYRQGFRFLGIFDRDQSTKTAALTASGGVPASLTDISDQDRAYLDAAIDVLMHVANGVDASYYRGVEGGKEVTECIPSEPPKACPDGQVRQFMPSVGYVCTPK